jgi:hypothetical protein
MGSAIDPPEVRGHGSLSLRWFPHPNVHARIEFEGESPAPNWVPGPARVEFPEEPLTLEFERFPAEMSYSGGRFSSAATGRVLTETVASGDPLVAIKAHVANFPEFTWHAVADPSWIGGLRLRSAKWDVVLRQCAGLKLIREAGEKDNYLLTHVLEARRPDEQPFSGEEAQDLLVSMQCFLSFVRGGWSTPVLGQGFSESGALAWRNYQVLYLDSGKWRQTWFDSLHPQSIMHLFPVFMRLWSDDAMREILWRAIYWYIVANGSSSPDVILVLGQFALDYLAWHLVFNGSQRTMTKHQRKYTSARINALLAWAGIPNVVPATTHDLGLFSLSRHGRRPDLRIGPVALTDVRNNIVHPDFAVDQALANAALIDACQLAMWYLELSILRLLEYDGAHVFRLKRHHVVGETDPVPWANPGRWSCL